MRPTKYRAVRTTIDGITFASKKEANRYAELKILLKAGLISQLVLQRPFSLEVAGQHICDYRCDFEYYRDGKRIIEDVKGVKTPAYKLKKKLVKALLGIDIQEV